MKRKLSAILSLLLAVVMVFPTAVMATSTGTTNSVTGTLVGNFVDSKDADKVNIDQTIQMDAKNATKTVSVKMAVGAAAKLTVKAPAGYTLEYSGSTNAVISYDAAKPGQFTAMTPGSANYVVTATKGTSTLKLTVNITVVANKIIGLHAFKDKAELVDNQDYKPGDQLTVSSVKGDYLNGSTAEIAEYKLSTYNPKKAEGQQWTAFEGKTVTIYGGDTKLKIEAEDAAHLTKETQIVLKVAGNTVTSVTVEKIPGAQNLPVGTVAAESHLLDRIQILAKMDGYPNPFTYDKADKAAGVWSIQYFEDANGRIERTAGSSVAFIDAYFQVTVEGTKSAIEPVKKFLVFAQQIPYKAEVILGQITKTFKEGYVLGTNESDWEGAAVTVYYKDENGAELPSVTYTDKDAIVPLKIVLSPLDRNSASVNVIAVEGVTLPKTWPVMLPATYTIEQKEVLRIEVDSTTVKTENIKYAVGDALNLSGIKVKLFFNTDNDNFETLTLTNPDVFRTAPAHGDSLNIDHTEVLILYTDPNTGKSVTTTLPLTVEDTTTIKEVKLLSSTGAKKTYFIGEAFQSAGFEFLIVDNKGNTDVRDLSSCVVTVDSSKYDNTKKKFTGALAGELKVNLTFTYDSKTHTEVLTLEGITVTKRPTLSGIAVTTNKTYYLEGEAPKVKDFVITARYDDNSTRVFVVSEDSLYAERTSATLTENGVTYTLRVTPTAVLATTNQLKVTYSEKPANGSTVTKTASVDVEVTVPDCIMVYYTGYNSSVSEVFADFDAALERIDQLADEGLLYNTKIRPVDIQLRRDVRMSADYPAMESIEVDLNGYDLTMIAGELYVYSRADVDTKITFSNTAKTDSCLIYSNNDDDTVIIGTTTNGTSSAYVITRSSSTAGKYSVTISVGKNGKVTGPQEVTHGRDAKFIITPNKDYEINTLKVNNKNVPIPEDGILTVENVQANLTVTVTFVEAYWDCPFTDVSKDATYIDAVQYVYERGLIIGTSSTKFEPNTTMTRAMFVTILGRLAKVDVSEYTSTSFSDVPVGEWYSAYVQWAASVGLVLGMGDGTFAPNDPITHAQMYVLMQRYASLIARKNIAAAGTVIAANDVKDIPDWAYEAVEYAAKHSFLITSSYNLTPNANAKRAELAVLLQRFCNNVLQLDSVDER